MHPRTIGFAVLALLVSPLARAQDANVQSLMFSARQTAAVETALKGRIVPPLDRVWLGSILYVDRNDWTVWINGRRVVPGVALAGADLLEVAPNFVRVRAVGSPVADVRLLPDQSLIVETGKVVSGGNRVGPDAAKAVSPALAAASSGKLR